MKIKNKFEIGEEVFYPGADLNKIAQGKIEKIIVGEDESISYGTDSAYGVKESDCSKTPQEAKDRLLEMMEEKQERINDQIDKAIDKVNKTKPEELLKNPIDLDS